MDRGSGWIGLETRTSKCGSNNYGSTKGIHFIEFGSRPSHIRHFHYYSAALIFIFYTASFYFCFPYHRLFSLPPAVFHTTGCFPYHRLFSIPPAVFPTTGRFPYHRAFSLPPAVFPTTGRFPYHRAFSIPPAVGPSFFLPALIWPSRLTGC